MLADWTIRLRALLSRAAVERELDEELRFHFERQIEQYVKAGMGRREAERRARLAFGGLDQVKEDCRDARGIRLVEELRHDLWYGLRMLRRRRLSSAAAIATLAVGIGLNAAVFSVVDWVLLRPLPYPSAHELVKVVGEAPPGSLTFAEVESVSGISSLRATMAFSTVTRVLAAPGLDPAHVVLARVAGDLFGTLSVAPAMGGSLRASDIASGTPVVVLSDRLWRQRWSADPHIVGRVIAIDGRAHTVVGVMPAGRGYPRDADAWRPLTLEEREDDDREFAVIARLASGVLLDRANLEIATVRGRSPAAATIQAEGLQRSEAGNIRGALVALLVSTGIVLLIACVNVVALLGAWRADRVGEFGVRSALGASKARLLRQFFTEAALLATLGGAAGLLLGHWALGVLVHMAPPGIPRLAEVAVDMRIVAIGTAATCVVGLIVALMPARSIWRFELRECAAASGRAFRRAAGQRVLVAAQAAMAIVLAVGAGLLARSLQHLVSIDHGFVPDRLVTIELLLRGTVAADSPELFRDLLETAKAVPGVRAVAAARWPPNQLTSLRVPVDVIGRAPNETSRVTLRPVTPGYFETAGIPLLRGRTFARDDRSTAPRVAIVNTAFARVVLQRDTAIGARLRSSMFDGEVAIVGEVADVTPAGEADRPALYVPAEQLHIGGGGSLLVRTASEPQTVVPALVSRLRLAAPGLAFDRVHEVTDLLAAGRAPTRFNLRLTSAFSLLALLLATVGVYGLTAGEVVSRWRELGVRIALGATRGEAVWTVIRSSAIALCAGILMGLAVAAGAAPAMRSLLVGVGPADALVFVAAPTLFVLVGLAASALAALPVFRADPAKILRTE